MNKWEALTAPGGLICSYIAISVPSLDDVQMFIALFSAAVCAVRSAYLAIREVINAIKKWREAHKNDPLG